MVVDDVVAVGVDCVRSIFCVGDGGCGVVVYRGVVDGVVFAVVVMCVVVCDGIGVNGVAVFFFLAVVVGNASSCCVVVV